MKGSREREGLKGRGNMAQGPDWELNTCTFVPRGVMLVIVTILFAKKVVVEHN